MTRLCDRCRFPLKPEEQRYSGYTGKFYCSTLSECERRLRKELSYEEMVFSANFWKNQLDSLTQ